MFNTWNDVKLNHSWWGSRRILAMRSNRKNKIYYDYNDEEDNYVYDQYNDYDNN